MSFEPMSNRSRWIIGGLAFLALCSAAGLLIPAGFRTLLSNSSGRIWLAGFLMLQVGAAVCERGLREKARTRDTVLVLSVALGVAMALAIALNVSLGAVAEVTIGLACLVGSSRVVRRALKGRST